MSCCKLWINRVAVITKLTTWQLVNFVCTACTRYIQNLHDRCLVIFYFFLLISAFVDKIHVFYRLRIHNTSIFSKGIFSLRLPYISGCILYYTYIVHMIRIYSSRRYLVWFSDYKLGLNAFTINFEEIIHFMNKWNHIDNLFKNI